MAREKTVREKLLQALSSDEQAVISFMIGVGVVVTAMLLSKQNEHMTPKALVATAVDVAEEFIVQIEDIAHASEELEEDEDEDEE